MVEASEQCAEDAMALQHGHALLAASVFHSISLVFANTKIPLLLPAYLKFKLQ